MAQHVVRIGKVLPSNSALFICDVQERFRPLISHYPTVLDTARRMIRGANILGVPVIATEQVVHGRRMHGSHLHGSSLIMNAVSEGVGDHVFRAGRGAYP